MNRILVVAAHPDDDILGCGAMLAEAFARGDSIRILYVTDGAASHPRSRAFPPTRLAALREAEAREAVARLGGSRAVAQFLRAPDGGLAELDDELRQTLAAGIQANIARLQPHLVFAPWRRDPHPDHRATSALVREALETLAFPVRLLEYTVWLDVRGTSDDQPGERETRSVIFSETEEALVRKRYALAAHRSQTTRLIADDPDGFLLTPELVERLCGSPEIFYEALAVTD